MFVRRVDVLNQWERRIGRKASILLWWQKQVVALTPAICVVVVATIAIAVRSHFMYATQLAWTLSPIAIAFAFSGLVALYAARHKASSYLGVKITGKNSPPNADDAFKLWCEHQGVDRDQTQQ
jgi:hypothetical protein